MKTFALYCISFGVVIVVLTALAWWSLTPEQQQMLEEGSDA